MSIEDDEDLEYKDEGYIELVLRIMALMCDGQNTTLQVLEKTRTYCLVCQQIKLPCTKPRSVYRRVITGETEAT